MLAVTGPEGGNPPSKEEEGGVPYSSWGWRGRGASMTREIFRRLWGWPELKQCRAGRRVPAVLADGGGEPQHPPWMEWQGAEGAEKVEARGGGNYVLHEFAAHGADFLAQGGAEHHDLLFMRGHAEDLLDIPAHIWEGGRELGGGQQREPPQQ